ncbi:MAG TPA: response regulator [Phenylobacterium sp.]
MGFDEYMNLLMLAHQNVDAVHIRLEIRARKAFRSRPPIPDPTELLQVKDRRRPSFKVPRSHLALRILSVPTPLPKVLLVDDDRALRNALTFSLELDGFEVLPFDSAEALLAAPLPDRGACLVLDERLPGMGGMAALAQLRARCVELPALLITSNPVASLRRAAAEAGVVIVEKPLFGDVLSDSIRRSLAA